LGDSNFTGFTIAGVDKSLIHGNVPAADFRDFSQSFAVDFEVHQMARTGLSLIGGPLWYSPEYIGDTLNMTFPDAREPWFVLCMIGRIQSQKFSSE
jgi:hypothetical protein